MNVVVYPLLHLGGQTVLLPGFEPVSFVKALEEHRVRKLVTRNMNGLGSLKMNFEVGCVEFLTHCFTVASRTVE